MSDLKPVQCDPLWRSAASHHCEEIAFTRRVKDKSKPGEG